jgi:glycosyltransferase involved in cell wall biosynthesis
MRRPRLGFFDLTMPGWTAGRTYSEAVLRSVLEAGAQQRFDVVRLTTLAASEDTLAQLPVEVRRFSPTPAAEVEALLDRALPAAIRNQAIVGKAGRAAGRLAARRGGSQLLRAGEAFGLSSLFPLMEMPARASYATLGWIPDFQHIHQPSFFSAAERSWRDHMFRQLASNATQVVLSSASALEHYREFLPEHAGKAVLAPFPSLLCFEALAPTRGAAVRRYNLPARFALVVNQLWAHKNPEVVVEAAAQARDSGVEVPIVLAGMPSDYRDPENKTVSRVLQLIATRGLAGKVFVLGKIPFTDLVDLMRCAAVMVQPSRFEGWSTSVEDAKALGRPLICSDLPVHREQAPAALGFFGCDDAPALARLLCDHFPALPPGNEGEGEAAALAAERAFSKRFGEGLLQACEGAMALVGRGQRSR